MGKIVRFHNNMEYYLKLFDTRRNDNDLLGALDAGRSAIKNAKTHIDKQAINILLGEIYFDMQLYYLSCEHFFRAIKIPMTRASAYFGIAKNLIMLNNNLLALDYLNEVLEWDYFNNYTEAVLDCTKSIKNKIIHNDNNIRLKLKLNINKVISLNKIDESIAYLQEIVTLYDDIEFKLLLAKTLIVKQDYTTAKELLFTLYKQSSDIRVSILLAKMCLDMQDYNGLDDYLCQIENASDLSEDCLKAVAILYFEIGKYDKSIEYFDKILKINEYKPKILLYIAICYYNLKDYENALLYIGKARWIDYENATLIQFYELFKKQEYTGIISLNTQLPKQVVDEKLDYITQFLQDNNFINNYLKSDCNDDLQWGLTLDDNNYNYLYSEKITNINNKKAIDCVCRNLISIRPTIKQKFLLTKYAILSGNYKYIDVTTRFRFHSFKVKMPKGLGTNNVIRRAISNARAYNECYATNINISKNITNITQIVKQNESLDISEAVLSCLYFYQKGQVLYDACTFFDVDIADVTQAIIKLGLN